MDNKKNKLANSFGGGSRRKKKSLPADPDVIEQTTKTIHNKKSNTKEVGDRLYTGKKRGRRKDYEGRVVKTSFDLPEDLYDALQEHIFKHRKSGLTMRSYLWDLIRKDLKIL